jgi:hypothetical protein
MPTPKKVEGIREYDEKNIAIEGVECIRHTDKACLMVIFGEEHWIPQRHINMDSEVYQRGHIGKLIITKWIATQRELWEE